MTPEKMPPATVELDDLPGNVEPAALGEISVEGYHQPAVERPEPAELTPAEQARRAQSAERLQGIRERAAEPAATA